MQFRPPTVDDGKEMWRIASGLPTLDLNSPYAYLLVCRDFSTSSAVAFEDDRVVGFLAGLRTYESPGSLFVWQVGVAESHQGQGIAKRMLLSILDRPGTDVDFVDATVTPGNVASQRLFRSIASQFGTQCAVSPCFPNSVFPDPSAHDSEELYRVGPIRSVTPEGH